MMLHVFTLSERHSVIQAFRDEQMQAVEYIDHPTG